MYKLSKLRWVWSTAIERLIVEKQLTVPALDFDTTTFSAKHFETRAVHAIKFHENWHSSCPTPKRRIRIEPTPSLGDERDAIKKVFFLSGKKGEILVTITRQLITCWSVPLGGSEGARVAELVAPATITDAIVNEDSSHGTQIVFSHVDSYLE